MWGLLCILYVFSIHSGCSPLLSNCLAGFVTNSLPNGSIVLALEAGTYYIFIDSNPMDGISYA